MDKNKFKLLETSQKLDKEQTRKSLTYWQDVWRRLRKNKLSVLGLIGVVTILLFATVGQWLNPHDYDAQNRDFKNIPPTFEIFKIDEDMYVYLSDMYELILVSENGKLLAKFDSSPSDLDPITKIKDFRLLDENDVLITFVEIDFSYSTDPLKADENILYSILYKDVEYKETYTKVRNVTFILGTDTVGRDLLSRVMYGTGISLTIAFVAAFINFFVGVLYGSFAGFFGGRTDNIMMRIVDIINSIPLLLYVILLMVVLKDSDFEKYILDPIFGAGGLGTIIIALISVYWVGMARLVRGQVLSLKEQEYVLAARTIGVSNYKIVTKHLIPNALGPIIVTMTMMIPAAVFTEAFLSFIGLGISAPRSSLGTLTSAGADIMQTYAYQLIVPALGIAFMMLSFNFLGDGLRDALDPRLRKG